MIGCGESFTITIDDEGDVWGYGADSIVQETPARLGLREIVNVSCGHSFLMCVDFAGDVWGIGCNFYGQLGNNTTDSRYFPETVEGLPPIRSVHCGDNHTICITRDSTVWSFGRNITGQLGLGYYGNSKKKRDDVLVPTKVAYLNGIIDAYCGYRHTILLNDQDEVYAAGENEYGQLGLGDTSSVHTFTHISSLPAIKAISASEKHSIFLDYKGNVYGTGRTEAGQLGSIGGPLLLPSRIAGLENIEKIAAGKAHILCVDQDAVLFGLGSNSFGQMCMSGTIPTTNGDTVRLPICDVSVIATRSNRNVVQDLHGSIWVFGETNSQPGENLPEKLPDDLSHMLTTRSENQSRAKSARK